MATIRNNVRLASTMCRLAGVACLAICLVFNQWLLVIFDPSPPLAADTLAAIHQAQAAHCIAAVILLLLARWLQSGKGQSPAEQLLCSRRRLQFLLLILFGILPLLMAEMLVRPLVPADRRTTIFERDPDLGWRLKANTQDEWGGVQVSVNAQGLRGPDRVYEKPAGTRRILFLGDSVTFGYQLDTQEQPFPAIVESLLREKTDGTIETINAGVGGYSPWQYERYLVREGVRYDPDFVVVGFVLNDVTEKMNLDRFGGDTQGWQLEHSANNLSGWLSSKSALYRLAELVVGRIRYGSNPQAGAIAYELGFVRDLALQPKSARVEEAWAITLENLTRLSDSCRRLELPTLLVTIPYAFQLRDVEKLSAPQQRLRAFARQQNIPHLDLLQPLSAELMDRRLKPADLFLDANHLSPAGHRLTAELIIKAGEQVRGWPAGAE